MIPEIPSPAPGLAVRLYSPRVNQAADLTHLDRLCFGGLWSEDAYRKEIENSNSCVVVLETSPPAAEGLVGVGCLWCILEEAHITLLGVHPRYQRQRLGQVLLHDLLMKARSRDAEWATLEVRASNTPALALYQKFGFQEVGRRRRYYQDTDEDGVILWRKGIQGAGFLTEMEQLYCQSLIAF